MWFVPIRATVDIEVSGVGLDFEINLTNKTVEWVVNSKTGES